ncbi:TraC family protein [Sutterella wadsworthensis]|uniref:TraC family protein n=1 Tax=Sutterella wadsworthensis TaxID=40545 RepID=UPI0026656C02|nr:TraC family protein [Sutterella wadsworthensis]
MTHRQSPLSKLAAASAYQSAAAKLLRRLIPMGSRPRVKVSSELSGTGFENDLPDIESFGKYLPYDEVIDNHFVALSAADPAGPEGLGFTIEITPQTGVTPEMEKTLLTLIQTPLAVGSTIAVTVYASPAVEGLLEAWKHSHEAGLSLLSESAAAVARRSVLGRTALLERASREQILPSAPVEVRHFRVWLSVVLKTKNPYDLKTIETARRAASSMEAVLAQNHLYGGLWTAADYADVLRELLNPQKARSGTLRPKFLSPFTEMRWQLVDRDTELTVEKKSLRFAGGGHSAQAKTPPNGLPPDRDQSEICAVGLSAENYPQRLSLAHISLLLGEPGRSGAQIPCPFLFTSLLEIPDAAAEKARVNAMTLRTRQMMNTPIGSIVSHYQEAYKNFSAASRSFDGMGGVARMLHQMVVLAPSDRAAEAVQAAQALGRKASIDLQENTALHAQAFMTVLPCGAGPAMMKDLEVMRRLTRRTAAAAVCGMPVMTEYRGTGPRPGRSTRTPLLMLVGRKGQLFFIDPFANAHGSYSATVVGKPGSGKSVVMNELAASTLMTGGRVWVIDAGYSYQKLCGVLGGSFYEFGENAVWNLDPFQYMLPDLKNGSKAEDTDDSAEMLEMVVKVVSELMTAKGLDDYSESILTRCVLETASAIARCRLEGLPAGNSMERLRRSLLGYRLPGDDQAVERTALKMAAMLEPYAEGGAFERWFDGSGRSIDFSSARFCVLELDGLSAHKRLRAGVLMTLMLSIDRAMRQSPKSEAKLVLIDEAWDLMGEGASGRFIETGYRRARKLNGAFVTATQSIADFHMSETAQAAWRCADTRIFLRQDADNIKALEHDGRMVHDPWLSEAIASLTTVAGAWSEMESVSRWQAAGAPLAQAIEYTAQGRLPPEPKVSGELCPS